MNALPRTCETLPISRPDAECGRMSLRHPPYSLFPDLRSHHPYCATKQSLGRPCQDPGLVTSSPQSVWGSFCPISLPPHRSTLALSASLFIDLTGHQGKSNFRVLPHPERPSLHHVSAEMKSTGNYHMPSSLAEPHWSAFPNCAADRSSFVT